MKYRFIYYYLLLLLLIKESKFMLKMEEIIPLYFFYAR